MATIPDEPYATPVTQPYAPPVLPPEPINVPGPTRPIPAPKPEPAVSLIMPCGNGVTYFPVALRCALEQNYKGSIQIVFVDNSDGSVEKEFMDIINQYPETQETTHGDTYAYIRSESMPVGALRNLGTSYAKGDICISWDCDDWSNNDRVSQQVQRLTDTGKAVTGWHNILFWDTSTNKGYKYRYEPSGRPHPPYAMGTSQCYLKSWWDKCPFQETGIEDMPFTQEARNRQQLDSCDAEQLCVVRAHGDSKCPPQFRTRHFKEVQRDAMPPEFFEATESKISNT